MKNFFNEEYPSFLEQLRERLSLTEKYLELTVKLKDAIEADDTDALTAGIAERAKLIDAIDAVCTELKAPLGEYERSGGGARSDDAQALIDRTAEVFLAVKDLDSANMEAVKLLMGKAADDGKKLKDSRQGIGKYAQKDLRFAPTFINELQ